MLNRLLFLDFVSLITNELELLYSFHLCKKCSLWVAFTACVHIFVLNLHKYLRVYWHRSEENILDSNFSFCFVVSVISEIFRGESSEFFWVMQQPRYSPAPQNAMRPQTRPPVPNVSKSWFEAFISANSFQTFESLRRWFISEKVGRKYFFMQNARLAKAI